MAERVVPCARCGHDVVIENVDDELRAFRECVAIFGDQATSGPVSIVCGVCHDEIHERLVLG